MLLMLPLQSSRAHTQTMRPLHPLAIVLIIAICSAPLCTAQRCCTGSDISYFCQGSPAGDPGIFGAVVVRAVTGCSCDSSTCLNSYYINGRVPGYTQYTNPNNDENYSTAVTAASTLCESSSEFLQYNPNAAQVCPFQSSVAVGDPHMRGFDGRSFEFQGFHGGFFTLLTHARNEVNVLLDNLHHHDATFITAVGLVHPGHRIAARIDNGTALQVLVNGQPLSTSTRHYANATAHVAADLRIVDGQQLAVMVTPEVRVNVAMNKGASHLDVQMTLGTLDPVHGILGRTARQAQNNVLMGDESEYIVSDLFATDSLRSLYTAGPTAGSAYTAGTIY